MKTSKFVITLLLAGMAVQLSAQKLMTRNGQVKFFSEAPLENIEAINKQASSVLDLSTGQFAFLVPIKGFVFEKALMQEHFNENYLESDKYPNGSFKGTLDDLKDLDLSKDGSYTMTFSGTMTIHGTEKEISEEATLTVKDGKLSLHTTFELEPEAYGVKIPSGKRDNIARFIEVTADMQYQEA